MFRTVFACSGGRRPGLQPQASAFRAPQFVVGVCVVALVHTPRPSCAQEVGAPEVIYHNAKVVTVGESFEIAEAVAIRDGRIVAVGSDSDVRGLASAETRVVDLGGKTMVPGFYDNHVHVGVEGEDVEIETPADLRRVLEAQASKVPEGEWIVAWLKRPYWHMKMPSRWVIDAIVPNHPVVLSQTFKTGVNSLALERAGITRDTPDPDDGGYIGRDEDGEPTGVLQGGVATRLVTRVMPRAEEGLDDESARGNLRRSLQKFPPMGVTSVNLAGWMGPNSFRFAQDVYERWGDGLPRMTLQPGISPGYDSYDDLEEGVRASIAELEGVGFKTGMGDDRLKLGAIKMAVDGGIAAPSFWTLKPYDGLVRYEEQGAFENPDFQGVVRVPEESLYRVGKRAHDLGWQLGIHAIGDAAIAMVVDVLERILRESPRADHRHYVHHFTVKPPEETLRKIRDLDIIVSSQPNFTYFNTAFMVAAVSGDRLMTQNPQRSLIDWGIRMSYGSDGLPYGPLLGIWAAVTRRGYDGKVYGADEGISVEEAIRFYTMGSAYMTFDEGERGSIEVGKVADMVVLSEDILTIDPLRIRDVAVELTIIDGTEVFSGSHVEPYFQEPPRIN